MNNIIDTAIPLSKPPIRVSARKSIRRKSTLIRRTRRDTQQPHSIARVDVPLKINISIHAIDMLFRQFHTSGAGSSASTIDSSPETLVPLTHPSVDSTRTVTEVLGIDTNRGYKAEIDIDLPLVGHYHSEYGIMKNKPLASKPPPPPQKFADQLMDALFPYPQPNTKPYHTYYIVATLDGAPSIPDWYICPTATCGFQFKYFHELQLHWAAHPWNRRGMLVPVTAGGIRRLTFWQHKAVYIKSLLHRRHSHQVTVADSRPNTEHHQKTGRTLNCSDYGDIRFFGPSSYFVSPKVMSIEQVCMWEDRRDGALAAGVASGT
ncbi:hypothetical protein COEREDRAFT_11984 [Coemansia reversa NRRL 1564]|uniref:C2H2-type domain-containing protein n=1 Tax=Coemansia reversa (strain ATCC 12441 / NRRL 1564) TaxID=763665 RepID=A0A2G5B1Q4_COERN|nr:hypothetical protein COEREDRAFT_11984 [Coemansia reversa NRRL 1564]|eukprot:PIA12950.1 hypothetical protein COEREDRAFT_11984 [Coemansia reversa NRRL 1564]